jgi:acetylornithine deacetylase/succinyl-diaminopimelate desuccinylase-like protein
MQIRHLVLLPCLAAAAVAGSTAGAEETAVTPALIHRTVQGNIQEFFDLLALPNDAVNAGDVRRNVEFLESAFRRRGFAAQQLANNGRPLLFAEFGRKVPGAKTVLFYMHFDGQPVVPEQWAQKSPWTAALKMRNVGGTWEEIDREKLKAGPLDPDLRIFARSASDDKGPIVMFLDAFDVLAAAGLAPAVNVKVLLDSEEEKNSPNMAAVATANRDLLKADALVINDGPLHESGARTIMFGNRGDAKARLTVYGPKSPLHSGHYGNFAPNPAERLAALIASMKDGDGRVRVKGYYDSVKLTDAERRILAEVPDDEKAILRRIGIAKPEAVGANLQEALQYPSLTVRGMAAASVGDKVANIIPSKAIAEIGIRTTPGADPDYLFAAVEAHIRAQGYYLASGEPTDEERAAHDRIASFTRLDGARAAFTPLDAAVGGWAEAALATAFAQEGIPGETVPAKVVRIRMMGATVPTAALVEALGIPFVIVPMVHNDNNQHSFDENLRIGHLLSGVRAFTGFLLTPF